MRYLQLENMKIIAQPKSDYFKLRINIKTSKELPKSCLDNFELVLPVQLISLSNKNFPNNFLM